MDKLDVLPIPMHDYVLARMILLNKTAGGIDLPDGAQVSSMNRAEIVAVGPGRYGFTGEREDPGLKPGDLVLCAVRDLSAPPVQFEYRGDQYTLITSRELIAKLPPNN